MRLPRRTATVTFLTLAAADAYLASRGPGPARRARLLTKPLLMPTLAATTHAGLQAPRGRTPDAGPRTPDRGGAPASSPLVPGVQRAQGFSWIGDLALLGHGRASFLGGVAAFAGAHAAYIGSFVRARDLRTTVSDPGVRVAALVLAAVGPVMATTAGRKDPALRAPVAGYAAILASMFATSTTLDRALPPGARRRVVAGTALFLASDTLLGVQEFIRDRRSASLESAVMVTYTLGQWLIAEGAVAATRQHAGPDVRRGRSRA